LKSRQGSFLTKSDADVLVNVGNKTVLHILVVEFAFGTVLLLLFVVFAIAIDEKIIHIEAAVQFLVVDASWCVY
jgi:hypothetical protein